MKLRNKITSGIAVSVITAGLGFSTFALAGDTTQLVGKDLGQDRDLVATTMRGRNYVVEVDQQGKIKQVVDTGANGDGTDAQQIAQATSVKTEPKKVSSVELPMNYQGQEAVEFLGSDLPKVAASNGFTPAKFKEMLLADATIRIDINQHIFIVDKAVEQEANLEPKTAGVVAAAASNASLPIASPVALANAFKLHSKPGASKTIYLDFDGHTATGTAWSTATPIVAPAFDLGGDVAVFDNNELTSIISIWNRVAEDYIEFDVDITTEQPTLDALLRTNSADTTYGTRVVITKSGTVSCSGCGGIAYTGVISNVNNNTYQPAWVFQQALANNEKYIAEAISHEAGHTIGLFHDGQKVGTTTNAYYAGHGAGATGWAPIMGVGYYKEVTQWSNGAYTGANNQQDDKAVFVSKGILPRADDVGNTIATAASLTNIGTGGITNIQTFGVIETTGDVDMFTVDAAGGLVNLTVSPAAKGANLDAKLTLYNANGTVVVSSAPETSLSATISTTVTAGTYYLGVSSTGHTAVGTDYGYSTYSSLGQYKIAGSFAEPAAVAALPTAVLTASTLSGEASLTVNFTGSNSIGNGSSIGYLWDFGDGATSTEANPVHTYTAVGVFTASLTVSNEFNLTDTKMVQVVVTAPPLATVHTASVGLTVVKTSTTTMTAQVSIKVVDDKGVAVPNATVSGTWSGVFSGKVTSNTSATGIVIQKSNVIALGTGASATYTVDSISAPGFTYNPALNAKTIATVAW
jgi:PKD repeat protein